MKVGAGSGGGLDGFSRLDWPASELLKDIERAQNPASGENSRLDCKASELLREARRARAEAMHRWCQSLLHELRQMVSASLPVPRQRRAEAGDAGRRR
jgi:hypothetical protein